MTDTAKRLYGPAQPSTSNGTLYTAPAAGAVVLNIHITNTTTADATISLGIAGSAATAANQFLSTKTVPANGGTYDWSGFLALGNAETIQGVQGTSSALTVIISGYEQ